MARPQKQTVDYFPHRCKPGPTMFILETRYGDKGYAFWYKLLELLGSTDGHAYYFNKEANCEYLQAYTNTDKTQAIEILDLLSSVDAIDKDLWADKHIIWSDNFIEGIKDAYRNRVIDIPNKPFSEVRNESPARVSEVRKPRIDKTKEIDPSIYTRGKFGHMVQS
ncbi:MAG TPA: Lin1244/Lin1753 domain-containing protein [Dehalococcoidia bacterium]|nr:Lin1244/Lin1753 domain-containing protein [Dehalococcoidia bacterium]